MEWSNIKILRNIAQGGGVTNEYPFISTGMEHRLADLLAEGLVVRVPGDDSFGEIHITDKGRTVLKDEETT
jgi:hypothetical protein